MRKVEEWKLSPIFKKGDKKYCTVPIPPIEDHKGGTFEFTDIQKTRYVQSQTHPSIYYNKDGWNGHKYWLATTPFPYATDVFENACIYYGDEDENGNPPKVFYPINGTATTDYPMTSNPIVKVPSTNYTNSDPDLFFDNNTLYMISRDNSDNFSAYMQKSLDGQSWTKRGTVPLWKRFEGEVAHLPELLSPSFIKVGDKIRAYNLTGNTGNFPSDGLNNRGLCHGMQILEGTTLENGGDFTYHKRGRFIGKREIEPWHFDIFEYKGKYYAIICGKYKNGGQSLYTYFAESEDGYNFYIYPTPLLNDCLYYRSTAFVREDGLFVLYASTTALNITDTSILNSPSDYSPDGRYISLLTMNFEEMLIKLKSYCFSN